MDSPSDPGTGPPDRGRETDGPPREGPRRAALGGDEPGGAGPGPPERGAPPQARRGLGALGRSLLLAAGLMVAFLVGLVAVVVLTGDGERVATQGDASGPGAEAGLLGGAVPEALPEATLAGFGGGEPVEVGDYAGEPLLVNFWATWCAPCVDEMPALQAVHEDLGGQVTFLGVNVQDAPANAEPFVEELGISYDLAVDADGDYYRQVGSRGMPTTLLVDADGRIVDRHTGSLTAEHLRELLAEHLQVGS